MKNQSDAQAEMLRNYAQGPALLDSALAGFTRSDLDLALSGDSWSIRQIVHHIVDGDDLWKTCIKAALGNSNAVFSLQWYTEKPQMEWSESWAYASRSLEPSLALFRANRCHIVDLLESSPGACERTIRFHRPDKPEIRITVFDVLELHVRHLSDHIDDMQAIVRAHEK